MMKNILFDSKGAEDLNRMIQSQIAPHLFLICNYNPNAFTILSEDARFIQGIANLYKFAIDVSIIKKIKIIDQELGSTIRVKHKSSLLELNRNLNIIGTLRTFAFHNNDHSDTIDKTEKWIINTIHKKEFETSDDYTIAFRELERIGDKIYKEVVEILKYMDKEYTRKELIEAFQKQILLFYKTNNRLIKEELRAAYKARNTTCGIVKDIWLAGWCKKMYIGSREEKIKFLSKQLTRCKGDQKKKLEVFINNIQAEVEKIRRQVESSDSFKRGASRMRNYDYLDFYCTNISEKCTTLLPDILRQKFTMLPQDMIQYIIDKDFGAVPIDLTFSD